DDAIDLGAEADHLLDDLAWGEIALQPRLPRRAEAAGEGAADLGRDAGGEPVTAADEDRFDGITIRQGEEEFLRAHAPLARAQDEAAQIDLLPFRPAAERLGQIDMMGEE